MSIETFLGLFVFTLYILAGYYWCDAIYNDMSFVTNPLYKPLLVLLWIPILSIGIVYILFLRPLINWFIEVKEYYKSNKKE